MSETSPPPVVQPGDKVQVYEWRLGKFDEWEVTGFDEDEEDRILIKAKFEWWNNYRDNEGYVHHHAYWDGTKWESGDI